MSQKEATSNNKKADFPTFNSYMKYKNGGRGIKMASRLWHRIRPDPLSYFMVFYGTQNTTNVWSIKIQITHNLSLWLYEYFLDNIIVRAPRILHFKGLGMRNLQYEMRICQKSNNKVTKTVYVYFDFLWFRR